MTAVGSYPGGDLWIMHSHASLVFLAVQGFWEGTLPTSLARCTIVACIIMLQIQVQDWPQSSENCMATCMVWQPFPLLARAWLRPNGCSKCRHKAGCRHHWWPQRHQLMDQTLQRPEQLPARLTIGQTCCRTQQAGRLADSIDTPHRVGRGAGSSRRIRPDRVAGSGDRFVVADDGSSEDAL